MLLNGAAASDASGFEIGCGIGRITRWFAEGFGEVHGIDVAPEMIGQGVNGWPPTGMWCCILVLDSTCANSLPDAHFDLVFSYIVFQHIPSAAAIRNYIREAGRV